ncbi:MAG: hypothetical protein FWE04_06225 [Oscillospiraceae bacterium]|nr:hypothetical protein [Oscillospiraceae bacterium]
MYERLQLTTAWVGFDRARRSHVPVFPRMRFANPDSGTFLIAQVTAAFAAGEWQLLYAVLTAVFAVQARLCRKFDKTF